MAPRSLTAWHRGAYQHGTEEPTSMAPRSLTAWHRGAYQHGTEEPMSLSHASLSLTPLSRTPLSRTPHRRVTGAHVRGGTIVISVRMPNAFTCEQENRSDSARDHNHEGAGVPVKENHVFHCGALVPSEDTAT